MSRSDRRRGRAPETALETVPASAPEAASKTAGDTASPAFDQLFADVAPALLAFIRRSIGPDDAHDLVQEAFVRFLGSPRSGTLGLEGSRRYLYGIAANLVRDRWRALERTRSLRDRLVGPPALPGGEDEVAARVDVDRALAGLTERERALLWLAHAEGYSHREIASMLELRPGSVKVLLHRARRRVAKALAPREGVDG